MTIKTGGLVDTFSMAAYDTFAAAAETNALKVVLEAQPVVLGERDREGAAVGA